MINAALATKLTASEPTSASLCKQFSSLLEMACCQITQFTKKECNGVYHAYHSKYVASPTDSCVRCGRQLTLNMNQELSHGLGRTDV